jgi:hypothetical protein
MFPELPVVLVALVVTGLAVIALRGAELRAWEAGRG